MSKYKAYFIDLDGTIYQGSKKFASGKRFIDRLKAANIPYLFVTNNSTKIIKRKFMSTKIIKRKFVKLPKDNNWTRLSLKIDKIT